MYKSRDTEQYAYSVHNHYVNYKQAEMYPQELMVLLVLLSLVASLLLIRRSTLSLPRGGSLAALLSALSDRSLRMCGVKFLDKDCGALLLASLSK